MEPLAITAGALIPAYHLFNFLGGKNALRRAINADKHFDQYRPEEKEKLVDIFHKQRKANVALGADIKKGITDKLAEVDQLFDTYTANLNTALEKAEPDSSKKIVLEMAKNTYKDKYEKAKNRLKEDVKILTRLVEGIGQKYSLEDTLSRFYRMQQRVNDSLDSLQKLELGAVVDDPKLHEALKTAQQEQKDAVMKPLLDIINDAQSKVQLQYDQAFVAMQQWQVLENIRGKQTPDPNNVLGSITNNGGSTVLTMDNLDMENLLEFVHDYNESDPTLQGDDREALTAKNGQRLEVKKNADNSYTLEFELPRRLTSPFYYCSPYSNIKSATQDAITIYIASGHIAKGGVLRLYINHDDEKTALESAREQYLAAVESGLTAKDPKQFYMEINGKKLTNDEVMEKCFPNKEDDARLQKSQGIASRNAAAFKEKWDKQKDELTRLYSTAITKDPDPHWKNKAVYNEYKQIKETSLTPERKVARHAENEEAKKLQSNL